MTRIHRVPLKSTAKQAHSLLPADRNDSLQPYISGDEFAKAADTLNDAMDGKKRATKTVMTVMTEMMRKE